MHSFNKYQDHISAHYLVHARSWEFQSLGLPGGESILEACDTNRLVMLWVSFVLLVIYIYISIIHIYPEVFIYVFQNTANANVIRFEFPSQLTSDLRQLARTWG